MTKCKHDDGDCYCYQYNEEMTMSDSLQTIIDDLRRRGQETDNAAHAVWYLHYAGRLEALQKQPVAWMDKDRCNATTKKPKQHVNIVYFCVHLIRGD